MTTLAEQAVVRQGLAALLTENECSNALVFEAQLVVTELVTNAFIHGEATSVSVGVELEGPKLRLTVCHEHNVKPDLPDVPVMPEATALQGRGLAIVGALAAIDVNVSAGSTCIEAVISM